MHRYTCIVTAEDADTDANVDGDGDADAHLAIGHATAHTVQMF